MQGKFDGILRYLIHEMPTRELNVAYHLFTNFYRRSQRGLFDYVVPRILPTQKDIEEKAAKKLAQVLTVIKLGYFKKNGRQNAAFLQSTAERVEYRSVLAHKILGLLVLGHLERHGSSIFLDAEDIQPMADLIGVDENFFETKAQQLKILRSIIDSPSKLSYLENELIEYGNEQYTLQYYRVVSKDGAVNNLTMLIDDTQVLAGDKNPSIILVPGIACNCNAFNINERYSLARDLARKGYWVYLFEPRGMGKNKANFDVYCNLDTLIDYDLPAVVDFVYKRSKGKQLILLGHSMGGVVAEFMLQLWQMQHDEESLNKVKGLITLGMPGAFDKQRHIAYPMLLWLNYILPLLRVDRVPLDKVLMPLTKAPGLQWLFRNIIDMDIADMNFLINPGNFPERDFMFEFIRAAVESFPLGIGFQFQKAIYTGRGISRMDDRFGVETEKYSYTKNIGCFPASMPSFHFLGEYDPLAPPGINNFMPQHPHAIKNTIRLGNDPNFEIVANPSQINYFLIPETKHIDLLYGKTAQDFIHPMIFKAVKAIWNF